MGIAGRLPGDRAQAKPLRRVERGALDAAVVERHGFRLAVFEEQLAVVHPGEGLAEDFVDPARIHAGAVEKQVVGHGEVGHQRLRYAIADYVIANMVPRGPSRKARSR